MAKFITLTEKVKDGIIKEFADMVSKASVSDRNITFTKALGYVNRKANLIFTETAWNKMAILIREFDKEVAWHGVAYRGDNDDYIITDILVYPQQVTSATVDEDEDRMAEWYMSIDDDVFNHIRMQGHSHVNLSTNPSTTDINLYTKLLEQCSEEDFYIFLIWNKRDEKTIKIYDFAKNILFESSDCNIKIALSEATEEFLKGAKEMVREKVFKPLVVVNPTKTDEVKETALNKQESKNPSKTTAKSDNNKNNKTATNTSNRRRGRRKNARNNRPYYGSYNNRSAQQSYDFGDGSFSNDEFSDDSYGWPNSNSVYELLD